MNNKTGILVHNVNVRKEEGNKGYIYVYMGV